MGLAAELVRMRIVYIVGLAHSGTTIIDRMLSCFPGVIGLGEVDQIIRKVGLRTIAKHACPCGAEATACAFWKHIVGGTYEAPADFFGDVVKTARSQGYSTIVDSSKTVGTATHYRRMLSRNEVTDVALVRVVRDPRGWVHSMMRREKIEPTDHLSVRKLFYRWLLSSIKLDTKMQKQGRTPIYVWYDKLILAREESKLAALIGLPPVPDGKFSLLAANQHSIAGNKFAFSEKREKLTYDIRWLESPVVENTYSSLPMVRAYYHGLQALHLSKDAQLEALPKSSVVAEIQESLDKGDFSAIEKSISRLRHSEHTDLGL
jgi:hypothetical protein